jgi:hypothetical protein
MILADTSVWIDHFRRGNDHFSDLLEKDRISLHSFILGELACGNLKNRLKTLDWLQNLSFVTLAREEEALLFIETHKLYGIGLGYVDAHILASAKLSGFALWTLDKRLQEIARSLKVSYNYKA